jgi:hypothetical protein
MTGRPGSAGRPLCAASFGGAIAQHIRQLRGLLWVGSHRSPLLLSAVKLSAYIDAFRSFTVLTAWLAEGAGPMRGCYVRRVSRRQALSGIWHRDWLVVRSDLGARKDIGRV